jgi:predicted dienelactone hydrolase
MTTEDEIFRFAEDLYEKFIKTLHRTESPFALLAQDNATYPELPGITSANLRNVMIGGSSLGTATFSELIMARVEYDVSISKVSHSIQNVESGGAISTYLNLPKYDVENVLLDRIQSSTHIITQRIWSKEVQKKYIRKSHDLPSGMLPKAVIRALFGVTRKKRVALFELQLPLRVRVSLLNECINICNVSLNVQSQKITEAVAVRAYNRIVGDPNGKHRTVIDLCSKANGFPMALANAIKQHGYIDEWACQVGYNHTLNKTITADDKKKRRSAIKPLKQPFRRLHHRSKSIHLNMAKKENSFGL